MPALTGVAMRANWFLDDAWCRGCGLHEAVYGEHRADCTAEPTPTICDVDDCDAIRLPSERGPCWQYQPATNTYRCPTHHQKGTTP